MKRLEDMTVIEMAARYVRHRLCQRKRNREHHYRGLEDPEYMARKHERDANYRERLKESIR